jgi:hypothetical protein
MKLFNVSPRVSPLQPSYVYTHLVILSNILLGSRIKVGSTTRLKSAPGRSCEMMCERTIPRISHLSSLPTIFERRVAHHFLDQVRQQSSRPPGHPISPRRPRIDCLCFPDMLASIHEAATAPSQETTEGDKQEGNILAPDVRRWECMLTILAVWSISHILDVHLVIRPGCQESRSGRFCW